MFADTERLAPTRLPGLTHRFLNGNPRIALAALAQTTPRNSGNDFSSRTRRLHPPSQSSRPLGFARPHLHRVGLRISPISSLANWRLHPRKLPIPDQPARNYTSEGVSPCLIASFTSEGKLSTFSLRIMRLRYTATVPLETARRLAISLLDFPETSR